MLSFMFSLRNVSSCHFEEGETLYHHFIYHLFIYYLSLFITIPIFFFFKPFFLFSVVVILLLRENNNDNLIKIFFDLRTCALLQQRPIPITKHFKAFSVMILYKV